MSPRTLQRQFQQSVGLTPLEWLTRERIGNVKQLLESTRQSTAQIAGKTGFGSEESLRKHFRRIVGITAQIYRKQFGLINSCTRQLNTIF
jgi:AraC family transcriptional regulator, transcriptional activator FtrA